MLIWFQFLAIKKFFNSSDPQQNWIKQLQWKPFPMEDVRNLKTLGLAQNYRVQISTLLMFEIKTEKKKNFFEAP